MPRLATTRRRLALAGVLAAAGLATLAGCGGEGEGRPIPAATARNILARLDEVGRRVDARACNDIRDDSLPALQREVEGLSERVDTNVKATLDDGLGRLEELVNTQCKKRPRRRRPPSEPTIVPTPEPQTPTPTQPQQPSQPQTPQPQEPDTGGNDGGDTGGDGGSGGDGGGGSGDGSGGGNGNPGDGTGSLPDGGEPPGGVGGGRGVVSPPGAGGDST